ncbi:MAG: S9 family peptidase [Candidatus Neomarinimicrobiota bacterium]|nr:MAG: S9 family peptidase [Candidatus Neomarinimicrobiota bacterium]
MKRVWLFSGLLVLGSCAHQLNRNIVYPETRKDLHVIDDYFGVKVADPYRWLEDDNSAETRAWVEAENRVTFNYLDQIPYRPLIRQRLEEIWNVPKYSVPFRKKGRTFFFKNDGLQNQSVLYIQRAEDEEPTILLDPNTFSEDGTVALKGVYISHDGSYLGYSISSGGSDWQEFYVLELDTQQPLKDHLKWAKFSGMSWYGDGFFYNRFPEPKPGEELTDVNQNSAIYYHQLGHDQAEDTLIFRDPEHPRRSPWVDVTEDEQYLILYQSKGTHGTSLAFKKLADPGSDFIPVISDFEEEHAIITTDGKYLIAWTTLGAPKKRVVRIDPEHPDPANWVTIIPEAEDVLESVTTAGGMLFGHYLHHASSRIRVFDLQGVEQEEVKLPGLGVVNGFSGNREDHDVFYSFTSFTTPPQIYRYDWKTHQSELERKTEIDFNPDDYLVDEAFPISRDGTRLHLFIVRRKDVPLDGTNPTLLYGYGGFNISLKPYFSTSNLILLEQGGIYALANLRGGGEYGEEWHRAGMLDKKQNVFDDFIAAAEYLIQNKYTSPEKLAIRGGSNGGLLIGAVVNQRPDLFRVAFPAVGVMDMLRYHKFTIGWAWAVEYGSSDDQEQFATLYQYSPLHNIRADQNYPAILITTADHDDRVVPAHSFKYAATLQDTYHGPNPILIRVETRAGHGAGKPTSKIIAEMADIWSFMFYNMGVDYHHPR